MQDLGPKSLLRINYFVFAGRSQSALRLSMRDSFDRLTGKCVRLFRFMCYSYVRYSITATDQTRIRHTPTTVLPTIASERPRLSPIMSDGSATLAFGEHQQDLSVTCDDFCLSP